MGVLIRLSGVELGIGEELAVVPVVVVAVVAAVVGVVVVVDGPGFASLSVPSRFR